jgi:hypothetical protein|tara:strand:- start:11 stop:352 length:342 start_codon:yes stop_codon:yes gene_type:complete
MTKLYEVNKSGRLIIHCEREREYASELLKKLEGLRSREKALQPKAKHYESMMKYINDEYGAMNLSRKEAEATIKRKYKKELSEIQKFEDTINELWDRMYGIETLLGKEHARVL